MRLASRPAPRYSDPAYQKAASRERYRLWRLKYPERELEKQRRRRQNPTVKLVGSLYRRVYRALKGGHKVATTADLLGCTIEEFRSWISGWFSPAMSWENYGKVWHIDHRRPVSSFDMGKPEDQKKCFHYLNLQPLYALDNLKKGASYPKITQ